MFAEVAALQGLLQGVALPAWKRDLVAYAREQPGGDEAVRLLERIPDREYRSLDDVGETLLSVQPETSKPAAPPPREGDRPPGGDDYVNPEPEPGFVRDDSPPDNPPQKAIEEQGKTLKEQQRRQQQRLGG